MRVDFDPGYVAPRHTHPGEEIIYVIEGSLEYPHPPLPGLRRLRGRASRSPCPPARTAEIDGKISKVKAGDVLFVPAGVIHTARNLGSGNGAELATYIVEKGKPLLTVIK